MGLFSDITGKGILGGAMGLAGGLLGGIARRRAMRKNLGMLEDKKNENADWYNRRYNEDATQRADAQRVLAATEEAIMNRNRAAAGQAAVTGGTEESVAATKAANANALADATSSIAAAGEARKDAVENTYMSKNDALDEKIRETKTGMPSVLDIAAGGIGGAANGLLNA